MVDEKAMMLMQIKSCKENIEFYIKEIQHMESKIEALKKEVRGRGLKIAEG